MPPERFWGQPFPCRLSDARVVSRRYHMGSRLYVMPVRMTHEEQQRLKELAQRENRTMANMVRALINKASPGCDPNAARSPQPGPAKRGGKLRSE